MKHKKMNKKLLMGYVILALIILMAFVSLFYTPYGPEQMDRDARFEAPSFNHLLGTDNFGRDIFSRVMVGTRVSLCIAGSSIVLSLITGIVLGAVLGYFGSFADKIIIRILDAIASFPSMLLALICVSVMGTGVKSMITALYIAFIPSFTRIVRAEYLKEKNAEYVLNARLMGAGAFRIIFVHILPGLKSVIISAAIVGFNNAVMAESSLSYLGLGIQPPKASLGKMLAYAQSSLVNAPWCIAPGGVLILIILSAGLINEANPTKTFIEDPRRIRKSVGAAVSGSLMPASGSSIVESGSSAAASECLQGGVDDDLILDVKRLSVFFEDDAEKAVDDISFYVKKGQILGIVGESGSGKSVTAMSLTSLLRKEALIESEGIFFNGKDISELDAKDLRLLRSVDIGYIFQEPMQALNPLLKIGKQLEEALPSNIKDKQLRKQKITDALTGVKLEETDRVYDSYPCELSGGMCQRVLIAMAMLRSPKLLIADEPTTALDRKTALSIIELLKEINKETQTAIIFISHDLYMVKELCDDVLVMEDGKVVERAITQELFVSPKKDYTKKLIGSYLGNLKFTTGEKNDNIPVITGAYLGNLDFKDEEKNEDRPVITGEDLYAGYGKGKKRLNVINDISFEVRRGETVGILGPSGSGKSTLAKVLCGFLRPFSGKLSVTGRIGMVFQNPYASLNPSMTVSRILEEPLILSGMKDKEERHNKIRSILEEVGLSMEFADRLPMELSGGQRQRVAIAAALISDNDIIILDEPVSALDATVAKQVLILLAKLKKERGLTYVLISHDEMVIESMCDRRIAVK